MKRDDVHVQREREEKVVVLSANEIVFFVLSVCLCYFTGVCLLAAKRGDILSHILGNDKIKQ